MGQVTLYLDAETQAKMKAAARAAGLSQSRWVAELILSKTASRWPASIEALAGAWRDLPEPEELRATSAEDVPREPL